MDEQRRISALDKYNYKMTVQLTEVIDGLVSMLRPHMSYGEYQTINSESNPMKKIMKLIDSIRSRPEMFVPFCDALKELKHDDLANDLLCKFIISISIF